jgi:integrase
MNANKADVLNKALVDGIARDTSVSRDLDRLPTFRSWAGRGARGHVLREGHSWVIQYRIPDPALPGGFVRARAVLGNSSDFPNYAEARAAGDRFIESTRPTRAAPGAAMKWDKYCDRYLATNAKRLSPETLATQRSVIGQHLRAAFVGLDLHEISTRRIQAFLDTQLAAGALPTTIELRFNVLRKMMRAARAEELHVTPPETAKLEFPVDRRVKKTVAERAYTETEIERILAAAPEPLLTQIKLALLAGLRPGEVFGLTWSRIHVDAMCIDVRQQAPRRKLQTTKTATSLATIPIPRALADHLRGFREHWQANDGGLLFPGRDGLAACTSGARSRHLRPLLQRLSITGRSFHGFRHTLGMRLGRGQGLAVIKAAMRLSTLRAAEVYVSARSEDVTQAIEQASLIGSPVNREPG